jgi:dUTP pyrophosphatase
LAGGEYDQRHRHDIVGTKEDIGTQMKDNVFVGIKMTHGMEMQGIPEYATAGSAGLDIRSRMDISIPPGLIRLIPTGVHISLPVGYEMQIRSRSGLAFKHGLFVLNAPGTIDSDYRDEIGVILANFGTDAYDIKRGERIAQMVLAKTPLCRWVPFESDDVNRGGGFGSTGNK